MNEKQYKIEEVNKESRENSKQLELTKTSAGMSEAYIVNYQKQIKKLSKVYELRKKELETNLKRQVDNTIKHHKRIDTLIANKEIIHTKLKAAIHLGEIQCEYCNNYFSPQGISRHRNACASRPEKKVIKKEEAEIVEVKDDLEVRRLVLEKELKNIEKLAAKKLDK